MEIILQETELQRNGCISVLKYGFIEKQTVERSSKGFDQWPLSRNGGLLQLSK